MNTVNISKKNKTIVNKILKKSQSLKQNKIKNEIL